jgi:heat shock protein HtpX
MSTELNTDYYARAADWRSQLKQNTRRTQYVILSFFLIYVVTGIFLDFFFRWYMYHETIQQTFQAFLQHQTLPIATFVTLSIAFFALLITLIFHQSLVLLGLDSKEITLETAATAEEKQLFNIVEELKIAAGLHYMPRVYVVEADYMNAFASGYNEKNAIVAVTRGLLLKLNRSELQAVMAHELSHIRHGDIKLNLMTAILSSVLLIALDSIIRMVGFNFNSRESNSKKGNSSDILFLVLIILRVVLYIITLILTFYLSRVREFMADAGSVQLMRDNQPLASALLKIQKNYEDDKETIQRAYKNQHHEDVRRISYLYDPKQSNIRSEHSLSGLFQTHPPIEKRLEAIGYKKIDP